jgi:Spy/CpxP family protein refolding chaperone
MKTLLLLMLTVPALAFAQPPERPPGPPPLERFEELKLTDAQKAKIAELRDAERRKTIRLEADARIAEMDLEDAIDAGHDVAPLVARVADLRGQLLAARTATRVAVRALLTPEQRTKLRGLRPPPGPPR